MGADGADGVRPVTVSIDIDALAAASNGFHAAFPRRSAKRVFHITQGFVLIASIAALGWALYTAPAITLAALHLGALALFACAIAWRLFAASSLAPTLSRLAAPAHWPTYTILCPLYREANVAPDLIAALSRLDYPTQALDIKILIEGDDVDTMAAVLALAHAPHIEIVVLPPARPRTKPKALNAGLARARGDYVVVYDAEDRPHPQQLRAALAAFEHGGPNLACVQAPLAIDNAHASWIARQFAAEYAIQFREMLPLLSRLHLPLPLGGTSNHFRAEALRVGGGWDSYNVTEDADLGYRMARERMRADVIGPPTWEEAPVNFGAWLNQRTRWIKGHLQTWLVLMRNPFRTAHEMGFKAFAAMQLTLACGLLAAFAHGPLALVVLYAALSPQDVLGPAGFTLALFGYCTAIFAALTASAIANDLGHARAALTMPLYWPLASLAAYRALGELLFRPHHWRKTAHGVSTRKIIAAPRPDQRNAASAAHISSTAASL
jgi:cellulose synthase/poly-beta-1,6-N-acetylglucosamine synthase-like glycosyltransferase